MDTVTPIVVTLLLVALMFLVNANTAAAKSRSADYLRNAVAAHRSVTWYWQDVMGVRRTRTGYAERKARGPYLRWLARTWYKRRAAARHRAIHPPHLSQWQCLHRHEARWNDPNGTYYGGLQMDLDFQLAHGRRLLELKGTADRWTMWEQMWVAERAWRVRGFQPWPTRRYCGI
jgi:hypothetical protein